MIQMGVSDIKNTCPKVLVSELGRRAPGDYIQSIIFPLLVLYHGKDSSFLLRHQSCIP